MDLVAHIDADAFFVSAEYLRNPQLIGLPVIVAGSGPRSVVTTASYEARKFGVGSAMPAETAARLCPQAVFIRPDHEYYRSVSKRIMTLIDRQVRTLEVVSVDEAYMDISDKQNPSKFMRTLVQQIFIATKIHCSVGIGPNRLIAKVASDAEKPQGFVVLDQAQAYERFKGASPGLLPGIGPKALERLREMEIHTIQALHDSDHSLVSSTFGPRLGQYLLDRSSFSDNSEISNSRVRKSRSSETTFDQDETDEDIFRDTIHHLSEDLAATLKKEKKRIKTVGIKVRFNDWSTHTRAKTVSTYINEAQDIKLIANRLFKELDKPLPVRLMGIRVASFEEEQVIEENLSQLSLF